MKIYLVVWHHAEQQEHDRRSFGRKDEAIRYARSIDDASDPDWYMRPEVWKLDVPTNKAGILSLAEGSYMRFAERIWMLGQGVSVGSARQYIREQNREDA